jgi:hypothetical protein
VLHRCVSDLRGELQRKRLLALICPRHNGRDETPGGEEELKADSFRDGVHQEEADPEDQQADEERRVLRAWEAKAPLTLEAACPVAPFGSLLLARWREPRTSRYPGYTWALPRINERGRTRSCEPIAQ